MSDVDVLVVGAGPVGLLLAAELVLGGARVQVVEREIEPSTTIKAGSVNVASAELLARRGLLDDLRAVQQAAVDRLGRDVGASTTPAHMIAMARRGIRAAHFAAIQLDATLADDEDERLAGHLEAVDGTFVAQQAIESVLDQHAAGLGVAVRRGVTVTGLEQSADAVTVETDAGPIRAAWVVGCDGGRSSIRHAAGFDFPGTDPEITGRQAVVDLVDDAGLERGWNWSTRGVYCYGPQPGRVLTVEFDGPPADRDAPVTPDEIEASLRTVSGAGVTVTGVRGAATRWTDNARQVRDYRNGRVLLAGDAAHVHSPFSGQGLNLGLGDAMNLGWKLAAVVAARAPESLLDTYTAERRPVGAWVLEWTRAQIALMRPDDKVGALRSVMADLAATTDGMTHLVAEISGVARRIPMGSADPLIGRTVPDRVLDDGRRLREAFVHGRFVLAGPPELTEAVRRCDDRIAIAQSRTGRALVARPDGVVVWAADDASADSVDAVRAALDRWIRPTPRTVAACPD